MEEDDDDLPGEGDIGEDTGRQTGSQACDEPRAPSSGKGSFDLDLDKHVPSDLSHSPPEDISPSREKAMQEEVSPLYEHEETIKQIAVGHSPSDFIPEEPELEEEEEEEADEAPPAYVEPPRAQALLEESPVESKELSLEEPAPVPEPAEPTDLDSPLEEEGAAAGRLQYMSFDNIGFESTEPRREYMSFDNMAFRKQSESLVEEDEEERKDIPERDIPAQAAAAIPETAQIPEQVDIPEVPVKEDFTVFEEQQQQFSSHFQESHDTSNVEETRQSVTEEKTKQRELIILLPEIEQLQRKSEQKVETQPFGAFGFEQFQDKVSEIKETTEEHVKESTEKFEDKVDVFSESVSEKVTEFKDGVETVSESLMEQTSEAKEAMEEAATDVRDTVTERVDTIREQTYEGVTDLGESVRESVVDKVSEVKESQEEFAASMKDQIEEKTDAIRDRVSEKVTEFDEGVESVKESVFDRFTEVRDAQEEFVSEISEQVEDKVDTVQETIQETVKETEEGVERLRESVTDTFSDVSAFGQSVVSETRESIEEHVDTVGATVEEQISKIQVEAEEAAKSTFDQLHDFGTDFISGAQEDAETAQDSVSDMFGQVRGFGADLMGEVQDTTQAAKEELAAEAEEQAREAKHFFSETIEIVEEKTDDIKDQVEDAKQQFEETSDDTNKALLAGKIVETVLEKAQERAKTPEDAHYEDIMVQEGSTIMEEEEEAGEEPPEAVKPSALDLQEEEREAEVSELTPTAEEEKPKVPEPHESIDGAYEASVVDTIVGRVTHDFEIGTEAEMKTSTGFKIGPIEYQAAEDADESKRLSEGYASSSSEHTTATRTVSSESSSDTMTASGGMIAAVAGAAVMAEVASDVREEEAEPAADEPAEDVSEEEIVSEKPLEVISKGQETQLREKGSRVTSEASVDRTESASIDSEDLEEPYGEDQQRELLDEMSIVITPSPQVPEQEEHEDEEQDDSVTAAVVPEPVPAVVALRQGPLEPELPKEVVSISSEELVKTSSSSDTSAEPTLLAATYDLDSGAISRVVASYDVSPDTVEKTLTVETQHKTILSSPDDDVFETDLLARAAKERRMEELPVCAEDVSEVELVSVSPVPEEGAEGGEQEQERPSSPFEVVDDSDLAGYAEYEAAMEAHKEAVETEAAAAGIGMATTQVEIAESTEPQMRQSLSLEQESPSFDHSSPISSSEPSDFRGPISPLDAPVEPLPGVAQPPVPEEIIEVPGESEEAADEEEEDDEPSYIHTNGPTEVEYVPEQDEDQLGAGPVLQEEMLHLEQGELEQEAAAMAFLPEESREPVVELEPEETEAAEQLMEQPAVQEAVTVREAEEEPQEVEVGAFAGQIAVAQAAEVTISESFHEVRAEEIFEFQRDTPELETSAEVASSEFATRSVMEDLTVTTTEKLEASDQTLYDLEMPADEVKPEVTASAAEPEEQPERPPSPMESMFRRGEEAFVSEVPEEYSREVLSEEQQEPPLTEQEQELEQRPTDDLVVLDDEPDEELAALADEEDQSPVEAAPDADAEGRTSSGSRSDPQLRELQASETPDRFDLKSDVLDERPVSPEPDGEEQEDEKEPEAKLPENGYASPLVHTDAQEPPRDEEAMDTAADDDLKVKASVFVASVMTEATARHKSDEEMISDEDVEEEERPQPVQQQRQIQEIEVHREYSPETPSDEEVGRDDVIREEDEEMEEMAESEEVPGITVTQHLHEEVDQEDYPTSYAPREAVEEEGARSQESDMEVEQKSDEEGDDVAMAVQDYSFLEKVTPPQQEMTSSGSEPMQSETQEQDPFLVKGLPARVPKETSDVTELMEADSQQNIVIGSVTLQQEFRTEFVQPETTQKDIQGVLDRGEMMIVETSGISPDSPGSVEMSDDERALAEELEGDAVGERTPDLGSPDKELSPAALVSDATGPYQVTTAISIDAADKLLIQPDEIHSPEDYGDSSSVDSFATVVGTHPEEEQGEDPEDRLAEVASMTSSVHSDIHAALQDESLQPGAPISIDVRDMEGLDEDETEKMSESSSSSDKFDVIEKSEAKSEDTKESSEEDEESYEMIVREDVDLEALQDRSLDFMTYPRRELEGIKEESESDHRESGEGTTSSSEKLEHSSTTHSSDRIYSSPDLPLTSPDLQGKRFFSKSGDRDDVSVSSSLLEFEELEKEAAEKGSSESFTLKEPLSPGLSGLVRGEERENVSLSSSLAEFEKIESEMVHSASLEKVKAESKSSEDNGSLSSLAEFETLEHKFQQESGRSSSDSAGGAVQPGDSISLKSSNSSLSEFERLEEVMAAQDDAELEEEAQKVVTLLESGALLPTDQSESDGPGDSPRRSEFALATLSQEQLVDPPELSRDASLDRDDLIAPVATVPRTAEDMDRDSLGSDQGEEGQKEVEEIIQEASRNVETFTEPIAATEAVRVSRQLQEALRSASIDSDDVAIDQGHSSGAEADIDSLDGRDEEELQKASAAIVATGIAGAIAASAATAAVVSDVVPAEHTTREIDADSLQGSDSQSKSGALDSDSLQDQDSVMQISADSFELDRTGASTSPLPEFQVMQRSSDSANIMDRSADSLEMDRAVAEPLNLMERSTEDSSIGGIMERSIDSLELDPSLPESHSRQSFDRDSLHERDSLHDTEPMTTESSEATGATQAEAEDTADGVMETSADSLNEPEGAPVVPVPGVMEMSIESGAWSQSSSLMSQDTLKSSGSEMYSQRDIMMVSTESPDELDKPAGDGAEKLERITEHTVSASTTRQFEVTFQAGASYHVTTEEMLGQKELLDSEGNITTESELMTLMSEQASGKTEGYEEHEAMDVGDEGAVAGRDPTSGSPMDQGSESGQARRAIGQMSLGSSVRPQSEQPVQFYDPPPQFASNLSSPSSESSHSETCYCGPAFTSAPGATAWDKPAKRGGSTKLTHTVRHCSKHCSSGSTTES